MPLSKEHKARTRAKIVESADRLFKTKGYEAVSIDEVMADAGLTRGGFYAHFSSKEDLLREVVGQIFLAEGLRRFDATDPDERRRGREQVIDFYLSAEHRDHENGGCPMAALSSRVSRAGQSVRETYESVARDLADELCRRLPDGHPDARRAAVATMAQCIGAMVIARATEDHEFSDEILEAARWATRHLADI